jgi:hypothetical protein
LGSHCDLSEMFEACRGGRCCSVGLEVRLRAQLSCGECMEGVSRCYR